MLELLGSILVEAPNATQREVIQRNLESGSRTIMVDLSPAQSKGLQNFLASLPMPYETTFIDLGKEHGSCLEISCGKAKISLSGKISKVQEYLTSHSTRLWRTLVNQE